MKKVALVLVLFVSLKSVSQNMMVFKDGKSYKATPELFFNCENYVYNDTLKVQIAKSSTGGILKLSVKTSTPTVKIGDKVLLILKNGGIIHCLDKNLTTTTENETYSFFILSAAEMLLLKKQNIENIRFRIIGSTTRFGSPIGHFTANNKDLNYDLTLAPKSKYDTVAEIKLLN
jgi:hypothetical protein